MTVARRFQPRHTVDAPRKQEAAELAERWANAVQQERVREKEFLKRWKPDRAKRFSELTTELFELACLYENDALFEAVLALDDLGLTGRDYRRKIRAKRAERLGYEEREVADWVAGTMEDMKSFGERVSKQRAMEIAAVNFAIRATSFDQAVRKVARMIAKADRIAPDRKPLWE